MSAPDPRRRPPSHLYQWLIPAVLGLLTLILLAILLAIIAAAVGLWPTTY